MGVGPGIGVVDGASAFAEAAATASFAVAMVLMFRSPRRKRAVRNIPML